MRNNPHTILNDVIYGVRNTTRNQESSLFDYISKENNIPIDDKINATLNNPSKCFFMILLKVVPRMFVAK